MTSRNIKLVIEYKGTAFAGWQIQANQSTVQGEIIKAVYRVTGRKVQLHGAGRTDAGVHALGQVAHFNSDAQRSERDWVLGLNSHLPAGVSVLWIRPVDESFHARFSAYSRSYRYVILNRWIRPALEARRMSWWATLVTPCRTADSAREASAVRDCSRTRTVCNAP